jgi:hypothetical protein
MKRLYRILLILIIGAISQQSYAQERGQLNGSLDFVFGAGIAANGGVNIGVDYFITSKIAAAPSYTHYFSSGIDYGELNLDAQYYFSLSKLQLYAIVGYTNLNVNGNVPLFGDVNESESGYNIGAGVYFPSGDKLSFSVQMKYASTLNGQAYYQAGLAYRFNK